MSDPTREPTREPAREPLRARVRRRVHREAWRLWGIWQVEPVVVSHAVGALLLLLSCFGLPITDHVRVVVVGCVGPLWMLLVAGIVRRKVTPVLKLRTLPEPSAPEPETPEPAPPPPGPFAPA